MEDFHKLHKRLKTKTLLYLEDEPEMVDSIIGMLEDLFKEVYVVEDSIKALDTYKSKQPDILLVDILTPGMNGLEFIKKIRHNNSEVPIIVLSANSEKSYLLKAIPLGLKEYLEKPTTFDELMKAFFKCIEGEKKEDFLFYFENGIVYNSQKKYLEDKNGTRIELHFKELLLIDLLLENRNRTLTKEEILNSVWGHEEISEVTLRGLVKRLREKIGENSIITVSGFGYRIEII